MKAAAEKGLWQHPPTYAYRIGPDRRLVLGPKSEVETVRRIFREYAAGLSLRAICYGLNADGIPSSRGSKWSSSMPHRILQCVTYVGTFQDKDVEFKNHHPAIIDQKVFDKVQQLLASRQKVTTPLPNGGGFLLTGLVKCGWCGKSMQGKRSRADGLERYTCGNAWHDPDCPGNSVHQQPLLDAVVETVVGWADDPAIVSQFKTAVREQIEQAAPIVDAKSIKTQLTTVEGKITKAKKRLVEVDSDLLPVVQEHLRTVLAEQERLQVALKAAQTPLDAVVSEAEVLVEEAFSVFLGLRAAITEAEPEHVRELIRQTVEKVKVETVQKHRHGPYQLQGGEIVLREQNLSCLEFLLLQPTQTGQADDPRHRPAGPSARGDAQRRSLRDRFFSAVSRCCGRT